MSSANRNNLPEASEPAALSGDAPRRSPLLIVWQRRWIIVVCLLLSIAAAIVYLFTAIPLYRGTAKLVIEQNARLIPNDPTGAMVAHTQNFLWQQCTLIASRAILEPVANDPYIRSLPSFAGNPDVLGALRGMVDASVGRRDDVISVAVTSTHADDAAVIANAIVVAFTNYHDASKRSKARELLDILQNQKEKLDRSLLEKRKEMLDFKTRNASFAFGLDRTDPTLDRLNRLAAALTEAQLNTFNVQAAHDTAKSMMNDPEKARQLLETRQFKSETAQLRRELRELQQRMTGLSKNYLPGFPELSAIQGSIKQLHQEMADEDRKIIEAYVGELEAQVAAARSNQEQIQNLLSEQRKEVLMRNTLAAQHAVLESELEGLERYADVIYGRIKELSLTEDVAAMNVRSVEAAVPNFAVVDPNRSLVLAYAILIGLALGGGLAFLVDWFDQRLHSAEEIKQMLGLSVLGIVPHIAGSRDPSERGTLVHREPMSDEAEAYRTIRTAIYFGQTQHVARTILITSPAPGDGKTTLASNLAIAMAQAGNRILLLDADFRRPSQHRIFAIDKSQGLSNVLAGDAKLADVIRAAPVAGLDVLPCGPIPANPSEILNSQMFADVLDELASKYDHVLLDSPPVMPVTDARILAASCEGTIIALRADKSTRKASLHCRDLLQSVGCRILGVVVNDVPRRKGLYGYYYTYGEGYHYQYGYGRRAAHGNGIHRKSNGAAHSAATTADRASESAPAERKSS